MFEIRFLFPADDEEKIVGLIGLIARRLPAAFHATPGAASFRPPKDAILTLEILAEDAADAVTEATARVRQAFQLSSQTMPSNFSVEATPAEELEPEDFSRS